MDNRYIGIDDDRLRHMRGVGERAAELGRELFNWDEEKCKQMFVLGFLHDVGYQFSLDQLDHEEIGGNLLKDAGYAYWKEVFCHGNPNSDYWSDELLVLNLADMETSKDGRRISMEERLLDIAQRYGADSKQYLQANKIVGQLQQKITRTEGTPTS
ncbi:MAG: HD domain-containing protein [Mobiluncus porci]|uniref:HD domain-containing protein n=1 Tax=Mobiluncus porci TaxID=2652278 RepID=UPI0023EF6F36|nr:HD domain-containing protein [Mobiluncus porci]MDD7542352.1 HD domain-containing protein [Mobiluncus porci]MDY5749151.1 HD domain-containing protein [Mobiluncus porci]